MVNYIIEREFEIYSPPQGGYIPFDLFQHQKEILKNLQTNKFNLIKKYRQAGVSSVVQSYLATKGVLSDAEEPEIIVVVGNNLSMAKRNLEKIREFLEQLPRKTWGFEYHGSEENEKKDIIKGGKTSFEIPTGAKYIAASSLDSVKGYAPTCVFFDEAAFIYRGAEMYSLLIASLAVNGEIIMASTPNGGDELFFRTYRDSIIRRNTYHITEINWWDDPRFGNTRWSMSWNLFNSKDEIIDTIENVDYGYSELIRLGYIPTNHWYEEQARLLNYNERQIQQEIGAEFVF